MGLVLTVADADAMDVDGNGWIDVIAPMTPKLRSKSDTSGNLAAGLGTGKIVTKQKWTKCKLHAMHADPGKAPSQGGARPPPSEGVELHVRLGLNGCQVCGRLSPQLTLD